ncbi:hypothetical protein [Pandoraea terrigena]|uniref:hypothetical protein n=1 Tax=Pandoraea terrigena TaxID=2508292 RepID=UPI001582DC5A|nr:hypothetical protein [Pandoraea terrigena]
MIMIFIGRSFAHMARIGDTRELAREGAYVRRYDAVRARGEPVGVSGRNLS